MVTVPRAALLPYDDFMFIDPCEPLSKEYGYILEIDLKYTEELHDKHKDFPSATIKSSEKLLLTLKDNHKYVVHYVTLNKYIKLLIKVTKIHRIPRFKEKPFIKIT